VYCSKCGLSNEDEAKFCLRCGAPIHPVSQDSRPVEDLASDGRGQVLASTARSDRSWFQEHLNWTYVICLALIHTVLYGALFLSLDLLARSYQGSSYWDRTGPSDSVFWAGLILWIGMLFLLPVAASAWYVRQKGRSAWWALIGLMNWIGWIVLLCLENKRE
jgi:uncharacterized membrane protein YhaH (DUF805 family)